MNEPQAIELHKTRLRLERRFNSHQIKNFKFHVWEDVLAKEMTVVLEATFLSRQVSVDNLEYLLREADWWEAFKERWFPSWLKTYFPVRWVEEPVVIRHCHICPHLSSDVDRIHFAFLAGMTDKEED